LGPVAPEISLRKRIHVQMMIRDGANEVKFDGEMKRSVDDGDRPLETLVGTVLGCGGNEVARAKSASRWDCWP